MAVLVGRVFELSWHSIASLVTEAMDEWSNDKAQRLGASLAFYSLLSLAPMLVIGVGVAALIFGRSAAQGQLVWEVQSIVGSNAAQTIQALIRDAHRPAAGITATIFGAIILFFGASSMVLELSDALNTIWHVPTAGTRTLLANLFAFLRDRAFSFVLVVGAGMLVLAGLVWSTWIAILGKLLGPLLVVPEYLLHLATLFVSFVAATAIFAAIYKIVPQVHLKWGDVLVGASVTSAVFTLGRQFIALYLGKLSFESTYGAAGSLVMLLVWIYYSAQLFFFGAEFTKVYARRLGSHNTCSASSPIMTRM